MRITNTTLLHFSKGTGLFLHHLCVCKSNTIWTCEIKPLSQYLSSYLQPFSHTCGLAICSMFQSGSPCIWKIQPILGNLPLDTFNMPDKVYFQRIIILIEAVAAETPVDL